MPLKDQLRHLADVLKAGGESSLAAAALKAAAGSEEKLDAFLISNDLWGGAGSVADQAGGADRSPQRKNIEAALVALGKEQLKVGKVNVRTKMWVQAFKQWEKNGI